MTVKTETISVTSTQWTDLTQLLQNITLENSKKYALVPHLTNMFFSDSSQLPVISDDGVPVKYHDVLYFTYTTGQVIGIRMVSPSKLTVCEVA